MMQYDGLVNSGGPSGIAAALARYGRFAYDPRHGFQIAPGVVFSDNSLLVRPVGGGVWKTRRQALSWAVRQTSCEVVWEPMEGVSIATTLLPVREGNKRGHRRIHRITTAFPIEVQEGGFACPPGDLQVETHRAWVKAKPLFSEIQAQDPRTASIIQPTPETNTRHRQVVIPILSATLMKGQHILDTVVFAGLIALHGLK